MNAETKAAPTYDDIQAALDSRYARFGLHALTDSDVWALGMATMVMPDGNPGPEAYLSQVTGSALFAGRLTMWGRVVAIGIASGGHKAAGGSRRRSYVESYDEAWGRFAVADGLTLALYGHAEAGIGERCRELGCGKQGYQRIRDFVAGALLNAIAEFRVALAWATGAQRDRVLSGRWEGVTGENWDDAKADAIVGWERGNYYPMFAPGCSITPACPNLDDYESSPDGVRSRAQINPETLYHGLRPTQWWDEVLAGRAKKWPVTTIYPATD